MNDFMTRETMNERFDVLGRTTIAAIKISLEKWELLSNAQVLPNWDNIKDSSCALCSRFDSKCENCPLGVDQWADRSPDACNELGSLWRKAYNAKRDGDLEEFKLRAAKLRDRLAELLRKELTKHDLSNSIETPWDKCSDEWRSAFRIVARTGYDRDNGYNGNWEYRARPSFPWCSEPIGNHFRFGDVTPNHEGIFRIRQATKPVKETNARPGNRPGPSG